MSDTPRSDEAARGVDQSNFEDSWKADFEEHAWVSADFARQLERELTAAKELAESNGKLAHDLEIKLSNMTDQRDVAMQFIDWQDKRIEQLQIESMKP